MYLICYILLIGSAELYYRRPVPRGADDQGAPAADAAGEPVPYLAVATTYSLLFVSVLEPWTEPVSGLAVGALLITVLVVVRQLLAVRENVRLLAETAVRQNEARFRSLVQHSSDVILVTKTDGSLRFVSPSAARVFGYDPSQLHGIELAALLHPEDRTRASDSSARRPQDPASRGRSNGGSARPTARGSMRSCWPPTCSTIRPSGASSSIPVTSASGSDWNSSSRIRPFTIRSPVSRIARSSATA